MRNFALLNGRRIPKGRLLVGVRTTAHGVLSDRTEIRFTKSLYRETNDTVWLLVDKLRNTTRQLPLAYAAFKHGVSQEELSAFKDIVSVNIDTALSILREQGFSTTEKDITHGSASEKKLLPMWLVLLLVSQKVGNRTQTGLMLDMVFSYFPVTPIQLKPSLLVMATLSLARFNVLNHMHLVVQTFLTTPLSYPTLQFNLLLQAISRFSPSVEAANQVVALLEAMELRQLRLDSRTYDTLLSDRFVTLQLVKKLRARMIHDGFVPTAAHLEAYLRVFAKNGAIHDARHYLDAIHTLLIKRKSHPGHPRDPGNQSINSHSLDQSISAHTANTLYLGAFHDDRASAFRYLKHLLDNEQANPALSDDVHLRSSHIPLISSPTSKKSVDIYDWTTALAVAARDKTTSSKTLITLFESARATTIAFRPTVATYTVLIRALFHRRAYADAEHVWNMLLHAKLPLDRKALTIGVQVLTRMGDPHRAFSVLESYAAKPDASGTIPLHLQTKPPGRNRGPIVLNAIAVNEFMVSLLRIGRPDVVFKFWDHMETLYGVSPNAVTLNILVKAARLSAKLDDTLAGAFAQLASKIPFRKLPAKTLPREDLVLDIKEMLRDPNGRGKGYTTTMRKSMPAWQWVIQIFQQVILGNWPELANVRPPAKASLASGKASTLHAIAQSFGKHSTADRPRESHTGFYATYPQIFPEDATFFAYIQLLGIQSLATEIPLALAWMRALRIVPSIDTLAMALVFWAEVSLHSPLIENWVGERSEYAKLVRWIRDWVGDERAPRDEHIRYWLRVVATIRTRR